MCDDLKLIKKEFGEQLSHLCRELFSIILETPGLLSQILTSKFARNHYLYEDIVNDMGIENFKNYIFSFVDIEHNCIKTEKSVKELMSEAGYDFYECKTESDIQSFKKYYAKGEELCTFSGNRLERCYVFFAVKKNINEIKRENFNKPRREDEYGTSVISIQFTRIGHTLSIKNRYNSRVFNPDATYNNNLENIIPGLTESFERVYNFKINQNVSQEFNLKNYVLADDKKYYRFNYEINNKHFCPDNTIIDNGKVIKLDKSQYLLVDYFIIDLQNKTISTIGIIKDDFISAFRDITKIEILKDKENEYSKKIVIKIKNQEDVIIEIDKYNRIIGYENNNIVTINNQFLYYNEILNKITLNKVEKIKDNFLKSNLSLEKLSLPSVLEIGNYFMYENRNMKEIDLPKVEVIGNYFLIFNDEIEVINFKEAIHIKSAFMFCNAKIRELFLPNVKVIENDFLCSNHSLKSLNLPKVQIIGNTFLSENTNLEDVYMPSLVNAGNDVLKKVKKIKVLTLPKLESVGSNFMHSNNSLEELHVPNLREVELNFLRQNESLLKLTISNNIKYNPMIFRLRNVIKNNEEKNNEEIKNIKNR